MPHNKFFCPHCHANLNPGTKVVLVIKREDGTKGILLLSTQVGNYGVMLPNKDFLQCNEQVEVTCPCCGKLLHNENDDQFAELIMTCGSKVSTINFSRRYGERATIVLRDDGEVRTYGEDVSGMDIPEMAEVGSFKGPKNTLGA